MRQPRSRMQYRWIPVLRSDDRASALQETRPKAAGSASLHDMLQLRLPRLQGAPLSMDEALATIGLPHPIDAPQWTPEAELADLLLRAAEIEHSLLLQYLYAAYTASDPYRGAATTIAVEEMGHLLTVQNLLLACGQRVYLGRDDANQFQPFPFQLEPMSRGTLAKFTAAEMPDVNSPNFPDQFRGDLESIRGEANAAAKADVAAHRVGLLYAKIYWLLRPDDARMDNEPWPGFPVEQIATTRDANGHLIFAGRHVSTNFVSDQSANEAIKSRWHGVGSGTGGSIIVDQVTDRLSALKTITEISAQGEGFAATPNGHFERFAELWKQAQVASDPIAQPTVSNPWYGSANVQSKSKGSEISNPVAVKFAQLADAAYETCLLIIAFSFLLPATAPETDRQRVAGAAVKCMTDGLKSCSVALSALPRTQNGDDADDRCGIPFSIPSPIDTTSADALQVRIRAVIASLVATAATIDAASGASLGQINRAKAISKAFDPGVLGAINTIALA
ncbi:hypothetical protein JQ586_39875 [Bradyrhizobium jicamae]|nr:hypothetical protein [Bradyrhizobium jicamae]